jgi:alanine racemase
MYGPYVEIDLNALRHNLAQVKRYAPHSKILAMLKANAYGHGQTVCALALKDADAFGVARIDEAIALRQAHIPQPIVLMGGITSLDELEIAQSYDLDFVVHDNLQIELLNAYQGTHQFSVWLKIDTGLRRLGFLPEVAGQAYEQLKHHPHVKQPFKVMTHLIAPEKCEQPFTQEQLHLFQGVAGTWPEEKSIAKSAAIMAWPETHQDWVRPGIMLYGISPFIEKSGHDLGLKPVMTLKTQIIRINACKQGDNLGYGGHWRCPRDMRVAIIAVGYADGYPRHIQDYAPALVNGQRCAVVGRVAMDLMMLDLTHAPDAVIGDTVTLWGNGLPIEQVALAAQTISYTLTTAISGRVKRSIIDEVEETLTAQQAAPKG